MKVAFGDKFPQLSAGVRAAENASLVGDVTLGEGVSIWYGVVLRGDQAPITVGEHSNIQDNAVVHVTYGFPTVIGKNVTVGHGAIVHGCTVEDECLVGMGSILLDGCVIGKGSLVAAGALVTKGTVIPPWSLVMGSPARVVRELTPEERAHPMISAQAYLTNSAAMLPLA